MQLFSPFEENASEPTRSCSSVTVQDLTEQLCFSGDGQHCFITPTDSWTNLKYLQVCLTLDIADEVRGKYEHSKLYYAWNSRNEFSEERVICFRIPYLRQPQRLSIKLPEGLGFASSAKFRLDPAAEVPCRFEIHQILLFDDEDGTFTTKAARLDALKQRTMEEVLFSEHVQREECPHYPESLNLELTARCNLTCTHCSSHGTNQLHATHNRMPEMAPDLLNKLADEVFPFLNCVFLVGRGEPLAITDRLWRDLLNYCARDRVWLGMTTNASYLRQKIDSSVLRWIDRITVSIDGFSRASFAANRGGDSLDRVLQQVTDFHELRKSIPLTRRPRLCFSWTLKKNNVHEIVDFAKFAIAHEADGIYIRHLLVFHEKDRDQSLLSCSQEAEAYLKQAYALLEENGIPKDCPPLVGQVVRESCAESVVPLKENFELRPDDRCLYFHRTATIHHTGDVFTCSAPFAASAGNISTASSFMELWNGPVLKKVRRDFGTEREWSQCRSCWYRELKWHSQRHGSRSGGIDVSKHSLYSIKAWDFRENILSASLRESK